MEGGLSVKYFGSWNGYEDMVESFSDYDYLQSKAIPPADMPKPNEVLFAAYDIAGYEGSALVIFKSGDELKIVEGSHCSCNELNDCWHPDLTSWKTLKLQADAMEKHAYWPLSELPEARKAFISLVKRNLS